MSKSESKKSSSRLPPIWLWPNLLSLDAPLVAVVWLWIFKQALFVEYIDPIAYWVLFSAVWCVYVIDRIIDVCRGIQSIEGESTWRHRFHWKYRWVLIVLVAAVAYWAFHQAVYVLPQAMLTGGMVCVILVFIYLLVTLFQRKESIPYLKNFLAGMIFAFGVAIPAQIYQMNVNHVLSEVFYHLTPASDTPLTLGISHTVKNVVVTFFEYCYLMFRSFEVVTFGLLCMMNIMAIDLWEKSRKSDDDEEKAVNEMILTMGLIVIVAFSLGYALMASDDHIKPFYYTVMVSAGLMHVVNRVRVRFTLDAQRVLADLAILLPAPLFLLLNS